MRLRMKRWKTVTVGGLLLWALAALGAVGPAMADAAVVVEIRGKGAADGTVTLTAREDRARHTCRTQSRQCRIEGVRGGSYRVEFAPEQGTAPKPRTAMIPPAGTVTLVISAGNTDS